MRVITSCLPFFKNSILFLADFAYYFQSNLEIMFQGLPLRTTEGLCTSKLNRSCSLLSVYYCLMCCFNQYKMQTEITLNFCLMRNLGSTIGNYSN